MSNSINTNYATSKGGMKLRKKKFFSILLILALALSFTACDDDIDDLMEASDMLSTAIDEEVNNQPEKITIDEFHAVKNGMTYQEVVEIIGGEGSLTTEYTVQWDTYQTISWEGNHTGSSASLTFCNGILESKMQFGL